MLVILMFLFIAVTILDITLYSRLLKDYKVLKSKVSLLENKEVSK